MAATVDNERSSNDGNKSQQRKRLRVKSPSHVHQFVAHTLEAQVQREHARSGNEGQYCEDHGHVDARTDLTVSRSGTTNKQDHVCRHNPFRTFTGHFKQLLTNITRYHTGDT